jgi:hypothetical protein
METNGVLGDKCLETSEAKSKNEVYNNGERREGLRFRV